MGVTKMLVRKLTFVLMVCMGLAFGNNWEVTFYPAYYFSITIDCYGNASPSLTPNSDVIVSKNYDGKVSRVGDTFFEYNYDGKISRIGDVFITYGPNGCIARIDDFFINYDSKGRVYKFGNCWISYDYNGTARMDSELGNGMRLRVW
jgi:hypothetical protein